MFWIEVRMHWFFRSQNIALHLLVNLLTTPEFEGWIADNFLIKFQSCDCVRLYSINLVIKKFDWLPLDLRDELLIISWWHYFMHSFYLGKQNSLQKLEKQKLLSVRKFFKGGNNLVTGITQLDKHVLYHIKNASKNINMEEILHNYTL